MNDYVYQEFPRVLYRPGSDQSEEIWGHKLDTLTVNSDQEKTSALYRGWSVDPQQAIKRSVRKQKLLRPWRFYLAHWKWFWGVVLGAAVTQLVKSLIH